MSRYFFGNIPAPYNIFNPPAYYQAMATDPTQVPVQLNPYGSGGAGGQPYEGPYPGFVTGQRTFTMEDALRDAQQRKAAAEETAQTTTDPSKKYLSPEGNISPQYTKAIQEAQIKNEVAKRVAASKAQNRTIVSMAAIILLIVILMK